MLSRAPSGLLRLLIAGLALVTVRVSAQILSDGERIQLSSNPADAARQRQALLPQLAARLGREDLTLADQLRGARALRERFWADPHRPRYHLMAPDGVWNDINGAIHWKGRYHLFFLGRSAPSAEVILAGQDSPRARETWWHASSRDLIHWVQHPPALSPVFDGSMPMGIFSGDAIEGAAKPTLIFHVPGQGIGIATAENPEDPELLRWRMHDANPVIPERGEPEEVRVFDPAAWKEGQCYYALIGNKNKAAGHEGDSTSLYRSVDLHRWEYRGPFYRSDRRWTSAEEDCACPDFFPLGGKHVLVMHTHEPMFQAQYYIGKWEGERFHPEKHGRMNWPGGQLSGPETLVDERGRRLLWGWIREARPARNGWGSVASLPRVLSLDAEDNLQIVPAPELELLRYNARSLANLRVPAGGEMALPGIAGDCLELALTFAPGARGVFGVKVRCSPDSEEETVILYDPAERALRIELERSTLDKSVSYPAMARTYATRHAVAEADRRTWAQVAPLELEPGEPLRLRVFLDRSVLEVFANDRQCLTQRIYPSRPDSRGIKLVSRGEAVQVRRVEAWDMSATNSW